MECAREHDGRKCARFCQRVATPTNMISIKTLILVLDLAGTFVFAISGAAAGVKARFDIFGVLVISFVAANLGGISRDLLIGAVPPAALTDLRYLFVSLFAGLVTFVWTKDVDRLRSAVLLFDAAGLALFAVVGAQKALTFQLNPVTAAMLGMLTGIGGGMMRDILLAQIPTVLRADLYAVAALAASSVVVIWHEIHVPVIVSALVAGFLCFGLRLMAIYHGWRLPTAAAGDRDTR
jgi:uncharacterized membrane protein YeiH